MDRIQVMNISLRITDFLTKEGFSGYFSSFFAYFYAI